MFKFFKNLFFKIRSRKLNKKALPDLDYKDEIYKHFEPSIFDVSDIRCIVKENENE